MPAVSPRTMSSRPARPERGRRRGKPLRQLRRQPGPRRDLNNASSSTNTLVPCSAFRGGGLWVAGAGSVACPASASMPPGRIISLASGPVSFDAHQWHCTQPWHGDRVVLVGFTVKGSYLLPPDMVSTLEGLGFALPGNSTGESTAGPLHPPRFPVFLELAGTGRVTARWRALGAPGSLAVNDQVVEGCATHPRKLDSAEAADQALALEWLRSPYVLGAHLSPPSGTCSRARDIRLPGDPGPPPLRSDTFPDGLPISSPTTLGESPGQTWPTRS